MKRLPVSLLGLLPFKYITHLNTLNDVIVHREYFYSNYLKYNRVFLHFVAATFSVLLPLLNVTWVQFTGAAGRGRGAALSRWP